MSEEEKMIQNDPETRAYNQGFRTGQDGGSYNSSPYPINSNEDSAWKAGFEDGMASDYMD